jgi:DNA-binding NtrC family response regulator
LKTADGDTLFLDEVGDIARDLQRLLIRAVEEGTYNRLGSTKTEKSTFRLITATNISDSELRKRLDPDFYDRIGGLRLSIPSLREVPEDLPWLWRSAFETALQRCGLRSQFELDSAQHDQVVSRLLVHRLDGNIRDLIRVANRVIARLADAADVNWNEVLAYAIACLAEEQAPSSFSQEVAKAFVAGERLDSLLETFGRLETGHLESDIRAYLATELRRLAAERKVDASTLCDVSSRTLRDWASRKVSSGDRQESSER